jgi:hypothetical protein
MRHALAVMLLLAVGSVQASTIVYSSPGIVTGIAGLDIGGTLYNVDFETGAYSTFGGVEEFWTSIPEASLAVDLINDVLNAGVVRVLNNDSQYFLTYNPSFSVLAGDGNIDWGVNALPLDFVDVLWVAGVAGAEPSFHGARTAWSVVPIPAAVWLFGSALAGLGWFRRRQTA